MFNKVSLQKNQTLSIDKPADKSHGEVKVDDQPSPAKAHVEQQTGNAPLATPRSPTRSKQLKRENGFSMGVEMQAVIPQGSAPPGIAPARATDTRTAASAAPHLAHEDALDFDEPMSQFADGLQGQLQAGKKGAVLDQLSLQSLRDKFEPALIAIAYENDMSYCDGLLLNSQQNQTDFIFVLDGLSACSQQHDYAGALLPRGLEGLGHDNIVPLRTSPEQGRLDDLNYYTSLLSSLRKQYPSGGSEAKQAFKRPMLELKAALTLFRIEHSVLSAADNARIGKLLDDADNARKDVKLLQAFVSDLSALVTGFLPRTAESRNNATQAQLASEVQRARAAQLAALAQAHPDKTIVVCAGVSMLHDTENIASRGKRRGVLSHLDTRDNCLSLTLTKPVIPKKTDADQNPPQVRFANMQLTVGDDKYRTSDPCLLVDYKLFQKS